MKKIISLCLVFALMLSMVPSVSAAVFNTVERITYKNLLCNRKVQKYIK